MFVNLRRPPNPLAVFTHEDFIHMTEQPASDPAFAEPIENLKAVVHYLNEGLVHNSLYRWKDAL